MAVHYLTLEELGERYSDHLTKKELNNQSIGTSITVNDDHILILANPIEYKSKHSSNEIESRS